jgi:drug/metabolite transporter (DMT)-like permease
VQKSTWTRQKAKAVLLTLLAGTLWGTSFPAIKIGLDYMDPYLFVFVRFLVASVVMLLIMLGLKKIAVPHGKWRLILFLGVINGVAYLLQYVGMTYTAAAKAALFINLSAIWVALLSPKLIGEGLGRRKALGVLAAFVGVVFVTTNLDVSILGEGQLLGDLLLVASGLIWAIFMIYNKPLVMTGKGVLESLTWVLPATLIPMIPFAVPSAAQISALPLQAWGAIVYTAIACWIIPYYIWLEGLKHISATTSSILLLMEILVAAAISAVYLGEVFTLVGLVGAVFIVAAIVVVSFGPEKTKK